MRLQLALCGNIDMAKITESFLQLFFEKELQAGYTFNTSVILKPPFQTTCCFKNGEMSVSYLQTGSQ
jgi:hypothetical protein